MGKNKIPETGIYDARQLGRGRMLLLGFQHMFAMFGATILVPDPDGPSTLSNDAPVRGPRHAAVPPHHQAARCPAFLGSSFAFLGGYADHRADARAKQQNIRDDLEMLPYACFGVMACAGLDVLSFWPRLFKVIRRAEGHALLPAHRHRPDHHLPSA